MVVRLRATFQEHQVDALVNPTAPVGVDETGMPLAVQLIGALGADERLLAVARWCEQALDIDLHATLA